MEDLHIHTIYSDGEYDEKEIVEKIIEAGIDEFSITDHDTLLGSRKVYEYLSNSSDVRHNSLTFHTGVELSCVVPDMFGGVNIHVLVRDYDFDNKVLNNIINEICQKRKQKTTLLLSAIEDEYGIKFDPKMVKDKQEKINSFGKPHAYAMLCELGDYDREEFYSKVNKYKFTNCKLNAIDVIRLLSGEKCYTTLAHPKEIMEEYNLGYGDIDELVKYLKEYGLDAIETRHSKHTQQDIAEYEKIANKYNLRMTQGSDYHGKIVKPYVKLGKCYKEC